MPNLSKCFAALGLFGALSLGSVSAASVEWYYTVAAQFVTSVGAATFNGAGPALRMDVSSSQLAISLGALAPVAQQA